MTRMKMFNEQKGKEMKKVLIACICTVMLASCGQQSAERNKLKMILLRLRMRKQQVS